MAPAMQAAVLVAAVVVGGQHAKMAMHNRVAHVISLHMRRRLRRLRATADSAGSTRSRGHSVSDGACPETSVPNGP